MTLEIRKQTNPNGDIFYQVYKDNSIEKSFWVGNPVNGQKGYGDESALSQAKELCERLKIVTKPIIEVIQSETIETPTHEPA